MNELKPEIKEIVVKYVTNWPKELDSKTLIETLDKFAREIINRQTLLEIRNELIKGNKI